MSNQTRRLCFELRSLTESSTAMRAPMMQAFGANENGAARAPFRLPGCAPSVTDDPAAAEVQVALDLARTHAFEVARAGVPALLRAPVVAILTVVAIVAALGIAPAHGAAAREVEVVLHLARAHLLEVAGARVPALVPGADLHSARI